MLHRAGIGVILDWVPAHFPKDDFALRRFDGTALYEHEDPRLGEHPDWGTLIFNYSRTEVRNFLIANALFWLREYHCDGLRVDAVASMLYLDYSRKPGEWLRNRFGGRENLDAIDFLRAMNEAVRTDAPGCYTIAEESTSWPGVTKPPREGGLGFTYKWNMGWMHDTLAYFSQDPLYRSYHQDQLTFAMVYEYSERFIMPLSHDEVVHLKKSLLEKMPGDAWRKLANLRLMLAYMYTRPGKKLLFMGTEIAPYNEWNHDVSLDWHLADEHGARRISALRAGARRAVRQPSGVLARRLRPRRLLVDRCRGQNELGAELRAARRRCARGGRAQHDAGAARELSCGRADHGALRDSALVGFVALWRKRIRAARARSPRIARLFTAIRSPCRSIFRRWARWFSRRGSRHYWQAERNAWGSHCAMITAVNSVLSRIPSIAMKPGRESTVSSIQLRRRRIAAPIPATITRARMMAVERCIAIWLPARHATGVSA